MLQPGWSGVPAEVQAGPKVPIVPLWSPTALDWHNTARVVASLVDNTIDLITTPW